MLASRILVLLLLLHQFWHQNCNCCTNVGIKNISFGVIVVPLLTSRMLMLLLLFTISGIKIVIVATMLASTILVLLLLLHQFWHQNCYCCTNVGIKNISVGVCSGGVDLPLVNSSARYEHGHRRGDADGCRAGIPLFYSFTSFIISPIKMVSIGISPIKMVFHQ